MSLLHVIGLAVGSVPELVFCAPGPRPFMAAFSPLLAEPLHFIMQTCQFHNLRTKVGAQV